MKTITYVNSRGIQLKISKFESGQFKHSFKLTFSNVGLHTICHTMSELRYILLENGMTRKWAANVKDRFDPLTEDLIQRKGFSEMLTTYMNPQLTRLDVVTTGDGYLLVLNQVMELNK